MSPPDATTPGNGTQSDAAAHTETDQIMRSDEPLPLVIGDVVRLRKPHPCGSLEWTVTRLGADIGIRCNGCQRRILLPRRDLEQRIRAFVTRGPAFAIAEQTATAAAEQPQPPEHSERHAPSETSSNVQANCR